ncbi:PAS domain-containing sensor histidine kinase [Fibrella forsythiae]|uniref:histidine kinase n=1 Tax=Fibrella forsythiae TaxID=2817061 RepID=A0ABS3JN02_9BACT|nr:PAS domain S-box protein [Fibrella forsythiae]MBO0951395.1 PAS domain S-box protein [Fibrella forsythiae]
MNHLPKQPEQLTALNERLDINFAIQAAGFGVWELDPRTNQVVWDERCRELFGFARATSLTFEEAVQGVHPDDRDRITQAIERAIDPHYKVNYDQIFRTIGIDDGQLRWVHFRGQSYFTPGGEAYRFAGIGQDVTQQVLDRQVLEDSRTQLRRVIEVSPVAMALHVGPDHRIELANDTILMFWGKDRSVLGHPFREAVPELAGQNFFELIDQVYATGEPYQALATPAQLAIDGQVSTYYFNFSLKPLRNGQGQVYATLNTAVDVTEQVLAYQRLADNEAHLKLLRNTVPAMIFYLDDQQRYQSYNETFRKWFGVDATEALGKTVREFLGEVAYQKVLPQLTAAYAGQQVGYELWSPSRMGESRWLAITYTPHKSEWGNVLGLIVHAADITQNKQIELDLRESEDALRNAINLAELGNFSIDLTTNQVTVSARVADWFGFDTQTVGTESFLRGVGERNRDHVRASLFNTLLPGSDGRYDLIHSVVSARTGQRRMLQAIGQAFFDTSGKPLQIEGTVKDITVQRELQMVLEQQVQKRTEELDAANEELLKINEELQESYDDMAMTNDQLNELNHLLSRSNENLQQFAYVASHDLQEPLRKIQSFGQLLQEQHSGDLGGGIDYLQRMQAAASRMSILIRDLLAYSRIATHQENRVPLSLNTVVSQVLLDLDLLIEETEATITVDPLPTLTGDETQLKQLFQNLLGNALKFRQPTVAPQIRVRYQQLDAGTLPPSLKLARYADVYYRIDVTDNGIGFEQKYTDRIFHVFQRLHGRAKYGGTGIGLAICEKVATNHGGAIVATSQPGQGATFSVYLPS